MTFHILSKPEFSLKENHVDKLLRISLALHSDSLFKMIIKTFGQCNE